MPAACVANQADTDLMLPGCPWLHLEYNYGLEHCYTSVFAFRLAAQFLKFAAKLLLGSDTVAVRMRWPF